MSDEFVQVASDFWRTTSAAYKSAWMRCCTGKACRITSMRGVKNRRAPPAQRLRCVACSLAGCKPRPVRDIVGEAMPARMLAQALEELQHLGVLPNTKGGKTQLRGKGNHNDNDTAPVLCKRCCPWAAMGARRLRRAKMCSWWSAAAPAHAPMRTTYNLCHVPARCAYQGQRQKCTCPQAIAHPPTRHTPESLARPIPHPHSNTSSISRSNRDQSILESASTRLRPRTEPCPCETYHLGICVEGFSAMSST